MIGYRGYVGNFFQVVFLEHLGLATEIEVSRRNPNWENFLARLEKYPLRSNVTIGEVSGQKRNLFVLGHSKADFLLYILSGRFRKERCLLIEEGASLSGWRGDNGLPRLSYFYRQFQIVTVRSLKCGRSYCLTEMVASLTEASVQETAVAPSAPDMKVVIGQPLVEDGYISSEDLFAPLAELGDGKVVYLLHPRESKEKFAAMPQRTGQEFVALDTKVAEAFVMKNAPLISAIYGHSSTSLLVFRKLNLNVHPIWADTVNPKSARLKSIFDRIFNV